MSTAVDLSALRVDPCYSAMQSVRIVTSIFQLKFHFKLTNHLRLQYFYSFDLKTNHDIHLHNTGQRHNLHITRVKHEFVNRCIRYQLPSQINITPSIITDKLNTHSFSGFSNYAKTYLFQNIQPSVLH